MAYRIRDWDSNFENNKSRERDQCSYVCMRNKMGLGLSNLLALDDGAAYFGIFCLIAEACSRQKKPRTGWLTDSGAKDGRPWTDQNISVLVRRPLPEVEAAMQALTDPNVGFCENLGDTSDQSARQVPAKYPLRKEGKKEEKGKKEVAADAAGHQAFIDVFVGLWNKAHPGTEYQFGGAKDGTAVGRVRKGVGNDLDKFTRIVSAYLADSDRYLKSTGHTLAIMSTRLNALRADDAQRHGGNGVAAGSTYAMPVLNAKR